LICTRKRASGTYFGAQTSFVCPRTCRLLTLFLRELIPERTIVSLKYAPQEHVNPLPDNKYEYDMTTERDIRNQLAYAEEKGVEKGMKKEPKPPSRRWGNVE